jgi:hypothetical protein
MLGLNSPVTHNGTRTTIAELAQAGRITFEMVEHWRNGGRAYFANVAPDQGWRIAQRAYYSGLRYNAEPEPAPLTDRQRAEARAEQTPELRPYRALLAELMDNGTLHPAWVADTPRWSLLDELLSCIKYPDGD